MSTLLCVDGVCHITNTRMGRLLLSLHIKSTITVRANITAITMKLNAIISFLDNGFICPVGPYLSMLAPI